MNILPASDVKPIQTSRIELMREVTFDPFSALPLQSLAAVSLNAPPVGVHGCLRSFFATPVTSSTVRFGEVTAHTHFPEANRDVVTVITLIRHDFFDSKRMHFTIPLGELSPDQFRHGDAGFDHCFFYRGGIGAGSAMCGDRDDSAGLHVHCILGFVGQSGASILEFRDLRCAVARTSQSSLEVFFVRLRSMRSNAAAPWALTPSASARRFKYAA